MNDTDTVTTNSVGEMEPPQFTLPVKDGYAPPNKTRGRKGTSIKMVEMIQPSLQQTLSQRARRIHLVTSVAALSQ